MQDIQDLLNKMRQAPTMPERGSSVSIPLDLHKRLKAACANERIKMTAFLQVTLDSFLTKLEMRDRNHLTVLYGSCLRKMKKQLDAVETGKYAQECLDSADMRATEGAKIFNQIIATPMLYAESAEFRELLINHGPLEDADLLTVFRSLLTESAVICRSGLKPSRLFLTLRDASGNVLTAPLERGIGTSSNPDVSFVGEKDGIASNWMLSDEQGAVASGTVSPPLAVKCGESVTVPVMDLTITLNFE